MPHANSPLPSLTLHSFQIWSRQEPTSGSCQRQVRPQQMEVLRASWYHQHFLWYRTPGSLPPRIPPPLEGVPRLEGQEPQTYHHGRKRTCAAFGHGIGSQNPETAAEGANFGQQFPEVLPHTVRASRGRQQQERLVVRPLRRAVRGEADRAASGETPDFAGCWWELGLGKLWVDYCLFVR